ncbi:hypothetical protein SADUNF_Sadunf19G0022400 [Salix dunnii]|uniref:Uncharacterized protein n=1 Tax=Salix dunnii TaxID=1413687 RepID=A0A835J1C6_9ROSI|nr:hypothetical protein SADUNF_Sadunf19G0022400 [Salix dunnii]
MQNSTGGTFQKHHQGPSVWHLEEEISFPLQATLSAIQGEQGKPISMYSMGGLAEYCVVPAHGLTVLPNSLPYSESSILGCAVFTAYGAMAHAGQVRPGDSVAVIGVGGVGSRGNYLIVKQNNNSRLLMHHKIARAFGASDIIAVDVQDEKLEKAKIFGAIATINSKIEDPIERIKKFPTHDESATTRAFWLYLINEPGCGDGRPYSYSCVFVCNEVVDSISKSSYHVSSGGFMRGVVLWEPNKPVTIEEFQMPRPKAGEVLIKTKACGVCHSDLHVIKGEIPFPSPCAIGHEITGEVVEHGELSERKTIERFPVYLCYNINGSCPCIYVFILECPF